MTVMVAMVMCIAVARQRTTVLSNPKPLIFFLNIRRKLSREQAEDVDAFGFPDDGYDYRCAACPFSKR
jgi:hypothetical protein